MKFNIKKRILLNSLGGFLVLIAGLILFAYSRTFDKTELVFRIHINEKLVQESTFGEPPTFAIWLEEPVTGSTRTVFVTDRAGKGDWEGKSAVPEALPMWFRINENGTSGKQKIDDTGNGVMAVSGATPQPGYFTTRVRVRPDSRWICWIEVNEAGDFNDTFREYDELRKTSDEYKTGQPALLYKAEIKAFVGETINPVIQGICVLDSLLQVLVLPPSGITTASEIFDEISIRVARPKPRIIGK